MLEMMRARQDEGKRVDKHTVSQGREMCVCVCVWMCVSPNLAWELSRGAVTRWRLLSLLNTRALPLASTPQPKLTSAPRSDEKL